MTAIGIVVAAVIAVVGWFVGNHLATKRERENDRREYRTKFLIDTWIALEAASNREDNSLLRTLEEAIARVQLLGTERQIKLAYEFSVAMAENSGALATDLLLDLRHDLRAELELGEANEQIIHLRVSQETEYDHLSAHVQKALSPAAPSPERPSVKSGKTSAPINALPSAEVQADVADLVELAHEAPSATILEAHERIDQELRRILARTGTQPQDSTSTRDLARLAVSSKLISQKTLNAVEGITVMRNLSAHGSQTASPKDAKEYVALVDGILYAMKQDVTLWEEHLGV
jgi:hypothetical protein